MRLFTSLAMAACVVVCGMLAAPSAHAQTRSFDFDRYEALDANVLASDNALALHDRLSDAWRVAASLAVAARADLITYIEGNIDDPALDAETREALIQVRSTLALDVVVLGLDTGDCEVAQRWIEWSVGVVDAPSVERLRVAQRRVASECADEDPEVVVVSEPVPAALPERSTVSAADEPPPRPSRAAGWALLGTGAALGVGTLIVDGTGASDRSLLDQLNCGAAAGCVQDDLDAYNDARSRKNTRSAVMAGLLAGAVGAGATGVVLLTRRGRGDDAAGSARVELRTTGTGLLGVMRF